MTEYEIVNVNNPYDHNLIYGYTAKDAFSRNPDLNPNEWEVIGSWYCD